ncbi:metalloregulator ArsR/SmtB family transcription factor [Octadecabacter sp. G9-8]|uniref:Metalloregulator ArsR/SmtB family transcription factor n=1 Tax=Octadecabacter dasysiphoniae TaxID=2909341 RepID=A0ABS9D1A6_9RHOB|nr:metalloregulator ArsR/SmtB family transcription factor [Octadecabacter dasysiphoniae]MCF2872073.1 metalloregulator ArsR/SmtB family transcription factor [Octadecabacter dasysiphoniae]
MTYTLALTALADPTRRHIFEALWDQPSTVTDLAKGQTVSRPAVSQHLKVLQAAQLVQVTPNGSHRIYSVRPDGLDPLRGYLDQFWGDALNAYGAEVRRRTSN